MTVYWLCKSEVEGSNFFLTEVRQRKGTNKWMSVDRPQNTFQGLKHTQCFLGQPLRHSHAAL